MQDVLFISLFLIVFGAFALTTAWALDSECKREEGR